MVNDRVCVKVQHLSQLFQGLIEFEMGPTCGKRRHKNVNVDLGGNGFIAVPVYNLSHFIIFYHWPYGLQVCGCDLVPMSCVILSATNRGSP